MGMKQLSKLRLDIGFARFFTEQRGLSVQIQARDMFIVTKGRGG